MSLYRIVRSVQRPTPAEVEHVVRTSFGSSRGKLPPGLLDVEDLAGNASRRQLLKGMAAASALGFVSTNTGCEEPELQVLLQAIDVLKASFLLTEQILGAFTLINDGDRTVNLEVLVELLGSAGTIIDGVRCIQELASGVGMVDIEWCEGLVAEAVGEHTAQGTEGGNDPVSSDPFEVTTEESDDDGAE